MDIADLGASTPATCQVSSLTIQWCLLLAILTRLGCEVFEYSQCIIYDIISRAYNWLLHVLSISYSLIDAISWKLRDQYMYLKCHIKMDSNGPCNAQILSIAMEQYQ